MGRQRQRSLNADFNKKMDAALSILTFTWLLYAVVWAITDGAGSVCRDTETALYAVLDIIAKLGFLGVMNSINSKAMAFDPLAQSTGSMGLVPGQASML